MTERQRRRIRLGLVFLTVTFLEVGLWATFATRSFYDDFPGLGRRWVAGDGPYNAHLASDAGVGFLCVGVVLLLASVWMERRVMQAALVAAALHGLPHLIFHLRHPNADLGSLDEAISNGGLLLGVVLAIVLLVWVTRTPASPGLRVALEEVPPSSNRQRRSTLRAGRERPPSPDLRRGQTLHGEG